MYTYITLSICLILIYNMRCRIAVTVQVDHRNRRRYARSPRDVLAAGPRRKGYYKDKKEDV